MTPRRRLVVAAPLVACLLVAAALLWTRGAPARQGSWCSGATVEVTNLLRRTERSGNLDRDQAGHLAEALGRLELLDADRFTAGAPDDLDEASATVRTELPRYRDAVEAAERTGDERPDAPTALTSAVGALLTEYYATCI